MKKEVKEEILKDPRFAHVLRDPRFKPLRKEQVKVKIDRRFQSMFHDKKFQVKSNIDKRGRPIPLNSTEDLKRFYEVSESDSDSDSEEKSDDDDASNSTDNESNASSAEDDKGNEKGKDKVNSEEDESGTDESEGDETEGSGSGNDEEEEEKLAIKKEEEKYLTPEIKEKLQNLSVDYARGQDILFSDSSSDEESSEEDQELAHDWGELDKDAESTEEATSRLAICNMNWDRAKAVDLMVLFHSFLPAGGLIHSITVYPSEYGIKKMKEEEEMGPSELREIKGEDEDGKVNEEAMEKLRIYQLNRLKYFYAIAVCDSAETANALYKACDGLEYECSSNKLDLRFVPEDMTFDHEPRETCTSLPDLSTYKPRLFQTKALTHSKAELTWDETDPDRQDAVKLAHNGIIKEDQLKMYLASSSSEGEDESEPEADLKEDVNSKDANEEESEKGSLDKYKALLAEIETKEKKSSKNKVDLEVTWNLGLEKKANELVKEKLKAKNSLTPFEQFLEKRKEKRKKKREERKKHDDDKELESGDSAFSDDEVPSDIDLNDPYFKEEMEQFKKKKNKNKKKTREEDEKVQEDKEEEKTEKAQLELLLLDADGKGDKHFNFKKIEEEELNSKKKKQTKRKKSEKVEVKKPIDNFEIDVNDERFSAIYSSHHFNIDPADSNFKMTHGTKALIEEKLKRRVEEDPVPEEPTSKIQKISDKEKKRKAELSVLVKTIKRKTNEAQKKIKR